MKKGMMWGLIAALIVLVGVLLYVSGALDGVVGKQFSSYQAVFLTNGQVYFGKVANERGAVVEMTDVYYLQVQQAIQPAADENAKPEVKLVKLGTEIHGPEDEMRINRDQVIFIEDLKEDGKVMQAVRAYQRGEKPAGE